MKSIWIPWLWPVFNQVFLMMTVPLAAEVQRHHSAEWLTSRFGVSGPGVRASHNIVVAFALLSCLGFHGAYGFVDWKVWPDIHSLEHGKPFISPFSFLRNMASFLRHHFTGFAMFYSILGGMHSIVLGDVIKYGLMTIAVYQRRIIAMVHLRGHQLNVPKGWLNPFSG